MKHVLRPLLLAPAIGLTAIACAQAPLAALGTPVVIDLTNTVAGVNNGLFNAGAPLGDTSPGPGQLDYDGWNYVSDASPNAAAQGPANFPGAMPDGHGLDTAGTLTSGISAVDIAGVRALAIQPTSSHWTSGSITLRAQNNTGGAIGQLDVAFHIHVYNDQARSNSVRFLYSLTAAQDSWVEVPNTAVVSPDVADANPAWVDHPIACTLSGFSMNPGDVVYLRWVGDDVSGSGTRDEFAFSQITITPQATTGPLLQTSVQGLPPFNQTVGTPSAAQNFILVGSSLIDDVTLTAPAPFEVSLHETFGYAATIDVPQSGGTLDPTTIYVRMNSGSGGSFNGTIAISSPGAATALVGVSGTAVASVLPVIYINELMASNNTTIADENGEFDDWFELFNPNDDAVDLAGWYASDDGTELTKYQFPLGGTTAIVPGHGFLLVWADNQPEQGDLHTSFSLSAGGEQLLITGPDGVTIVDSVSFGAQTTDVSYGLQHDGQQPWVTFTSPTPGASNSPVGIAEHDARSPLRCWPNPVVGDHLFLDRPVTGTIVGGDGRVVRSFQRNQALELGDLAPGVYVLRTTEGCLRFVR